VLSKGGEKVDKEKALTMALMHDIEESFSGDIIGPFKHRSKEVNEAIKKVNKEVIKEVFDTIPSSLSDHYVGLWNEEGEGKTIEAQIVKKADKLALIAKCKEEIKAGNGFFKKTYERELELLSEDDHDWWKKIKEQFLPEK